jgi:hypothetical protein
METQEETKILSYQEFRTGYTYLDIYHMIYNRKYKRRNGVLGFWRELKQKMYQEYLYQIQENARTT